MRASNYANRDLNWNTSRTHLAANTRTAGYKIKLTLLVLAGAETHGFRQKGESLAERNKPKCRRDFHLLGNSSGTIPDIRASVVPIISPPKSAVRFELLCPTPSEEWLNITSFPPVENSKRFDFTLHEGDFKEHTRQFVPAATAADAQKCKKFFEALAKP